MEITDVLLGAFCNLLAIRLYMSLSRKEMYALYQNIVWLLGPPSPSIVLQSCLEDVLIAEFSVRFRVKYGCRGFDVHPSATALTHSHADPFPPQH